MEVYGIDLGTTYSCICKYDGSHIEVIKPVGGHLGGTVLPSVVFFDKNNGTPIVGDSAKGYLHVKKYASQTLSLFKRNMGQEKCNHPIMRNGKEQEVSPVECSACVLHSLLTSANNDQKAHLLPEIKKAVVTIPAGFTSKQRDCVKEAAELAGIEVLGLIHEPTAAAISYNIADGETILVFDFGGGTLDISVVKNQNGRYDVLETSSDVDVLNRYIGGQDWDDSLIDLAINQLNRDKEEEEPIIVRDKEDISNNGIAKEGILLKEGESKKINLSTLPEVAFSYLLDSTTVTRADFERVTKKLVKDCMKVVKKTTEKCNERNIHIDRVVLTGGSSNMPMIKKALVKELGAEYGVGRTEGEWIYMSDPENAIAKGAAIYAYLLETGQANINEKSSHSYGTSAQRHGEDVIHNLIKSSDPMIMDNTVEYNLDEEQREIRVDVYESNYEKNTDGYEDHFIDNSTNRRKFKVNKIYDKKYVCDNPSSITSTTKVKFNVARDKDGRISITVSAPGQHTESHYIDTIHPAINEDVRNQIKKSIQLMDENINNLQKK